MHTRIIAALAATAMLVACGNSDEETAAVAQAPTTETVVEEAAPVASKPDDTQTLAAAEESDGSFDADAVAQEGSLRMAQNNAEATPQRFKEGVHYKRFRPVKPTVGGNERIEVAEVFWYGCNHCFNLEPTLEKWSGEQADDVTFVKMPAVWNPTVETHAQFFYTIEALAGAGTITDKKAVHQAFFDSIHVKNQRIYKKDALGEFLAPFGVSAEQFDKTWRSFDVDSKMRQAKSLNRAYNIGSVPTLVINGKFVTDEDMAGGKAQLIAVIDELVASER
ncbi:MAG: thiol:disulfide interchange protein DsbA/DsbL [Pseudomonadota bacterium]